MSPEEETRQRSEAVRVAKTFLHCVWRHMGRTHAGIDCAGLCIATLKQCGFVPQDFQTGYYPRTFMLHSDEQKFLDMIERFGRRIGDTRGYYKKHIPAFPDKSQCRYGHPASGDTACLVLPEREPRDADIAVFHVGRSIAHCAMVISWPTVIHAVSDHTTEFDDVVNNGELASRFKGLWALKGWT
jgi:hypothetical protein